MDKDRRKLPKIATALAVSSGLLLTAGYMDVFNLNNQRLVVNASSRELENPNAGILYDIWQRNIQNFIYKEDNGDEWVVFDPSDTKFEGDCEDLALTVAWDIYTYNQENGNVFSMGIIVTRSRILNNFKAHAGLIVYDRQNGEYFLIDNGVYRYGDQKGFIDLGKGERAPYEDFGNLRVNGKSVYDAYMMGLTGDPSTIDLDKYSEGKYWNQVY